MMQGSDGAHMHNQQQQRGDFKRNVGAFVGLCESIGYLGGAWWRMPGSTGSRYFSGHAFIGWFILLMVASFAQSEQLMQFWMATGAWILFHKLASHERQRRGYRPHSRFVGNSLLSFLGGNKNAICVWEPLLTFFIGYQMLETGIEYSGAVMVLAFCMFVSAAYSARAEKATMTAIHDARADQFWIAEYMRKNG